MKSSNLAILFVDIAGFTERTQSQSRSESAAWLSKYDRLLMPLVKAFGGRRVKTIGDAYLCTFISPTNALLFGMAAQDTVYEYNLEADESERFDIRISVNVGEVREQHRDVFGEPVNIAARLEGITPSGEIWFTEAVNLSMTKSEVPSESVGLRRLKGIREEIKIYRIVRATGYRLEGDSDDEVASGSDLPGITRYPFGGIGLKRAREKGWTLSISAIRGRMREARELAFSGVKSARGSLGRFSRRLLAVPGWIWSSMTVCFIVIMILAVIWPRGPFSEIETALDEGRTDYALSLLKKHPDRETAAGKAMLAHVLLSRSSSAQVSKAASILTEAVKNDPGLLDSSRIRRDLVACLNQSNAGQEMRFILDKLGRSALPELLEGARQKSYWLRWNSIRVLDKLGELDGVDIGHAYIMDLRYAGSCSTRKRAAEKLAELKDKRALKHLKAAKNRGFLENLCMGDTLDDSIRAIE